MSESKAIPRSIPQLRTTGAPPDPMSLRHPTTPLRQVSKVIHNQKSIGNCFCSGNINYC